LKEEARGPAGGFVYKRKQNNKGEEVGGIVPHVTLKSIAHNEPPAKEVLVDRPEVVSGITRVTGPFAFEATIPTAMDAGGDSADRRGGVPPPPLYGWVRGDGRARRLARPFSFAGVRRPHDDCGETIPVRPSRFNTR
jgi:adenine-specific DNA-methyltransferase